MGRILDAVLGQGRAVENARRGCQELSRRRVQREEVDRYLARYAERVARSA